MSQARPRLRPDLRYKSHADHHCLSSWNPATGRGRTRVPDPRRRRPPQPDRSERWPRRINVNFSEQAYRTLDGLAKQSGKSMSDVLRWRIHLSTEQRAPERSVEVGDWTTLTERAQGPAALEGERGPAMGGIPPDDRGERQHSQRQGQVRARLPQPMARRRLEQQEQLDDAAVPRHLGTRVQGPATLKV